MELVFPLILVHAMLDMQEINATFICAMESIPMFPLFVLLMEDVLEKNNATVTLDTLVPIVN
jgi:hypothetical protein